MTQQTDDLLLPILRAALDQTRSAACITTAELDRPGPEIVYVNPAYCEMIGRDETEVLGATPRIMQGPLTSRAELDRLRRDLDADRPFIGETVNYRRDGQPFLISWRIDPVQGPDGVTTHYIATQDDITALRRAERLLSAEKAVDGSVSILLSHPADATTNLQTMATDIASAVSDLVGYGRAVVVGDVRLGTSRAAFAVGTRHGADEQLMEQVRLGPGTVQSGCDDEGRCWVGCALASELGGIGGALAVVDLDQAELDFIDQAAVGRVAECGRRALSSLAEYERQRLVAIELQRDLLPETDPVVPGFDVVARYQPGAFATRVGGDWYDVVRDGQRAVLIVGDMAGSGVRAAADMGRVRLLVKVLLQQGRSAADALALLNQFCSEEDLVATALAVTIDLPTREVSAVSAGHLPPVISSPHTAEIAQVTPGPLLGIGGSPHYPRSTITVDDDTTIVMFTDGLIERPDELIDVSLERLAVEVLAANSDDLARLCDGLILKRQANNPTDDIAILTVRPSHRSGVGEGSG